MISIIAAMSKNFVIGKDGKIPWRISEDFIRAKNITMGHPIIMGQKTFESMGNKPLAGRTNIVLTNEPDFSAEGIVIVHSLDDALLKAKESEGGEEIFIFGGGSLYKQTVDVAEKMYLTVIDKEVDGDTFFPQFNESKWKLETEEKRVVQFQDFELTYYFRIYTKKS